MKTPVGHVPKESGFKTAMRKHHRIGDDALGTVLWVRFE